MMKSIILLVAVVAICATGALAQDTLRIATYNLLGYPGSDTTSRNPNFRKVLKAMNPDVLVAQEMASQSGVDGFRNNVLNAYQPGLYASATFNNGYDTDNSFFYKPSKVVYLGATYIPTALRDIAEYRFKSTSSLDTLRIFSVHLKASQDSTAPRLAEATILRNYLNSLPTNAKFAVAGDFNIYDSNEPAFQKLIGSEANNNGRCLDPLNAVGTWHANYAFRAIHTQSPRVRSFGGGSIGGMDDRFDLLLVSYPMSSNLLGSTYTAFGNDGNHFNDSINRLPNSAVPDSVANGLHYGSDHLPVFATFVFQSGGGLAPEPTVQASAVQFDAVTSTSMNVSWTNGNGGRRIVVARAGSAVSFVPIDGQSYSANSNFSLASDLGSGNKALYAGSGSAVAVTGLTQNTTYHYAVYEFNGLASTANYLSTSPATNSQQTLSVSYYSQGSLPPDQLSSWNSERNGTGGQPSDFTSGVPFVVQSGHSMTTTSSWTVSGSGGRIQIESGGTLQANHAVAGPSFQVDNGGTYVHNFSSATANGSASDVPGSLERQIGASSTIEFRKWANGGTSPTPLPSGVTWGNLTINIDTLSGSWQQSGMLINISGSLSILRTGGGTREFRLNANTPATSTLNLAGNLAVSGGIFNLTSGTAIETVNLGGSFVQTGGTCTATGSGPHEFTFVGGDTSTFGSSGGVLNAANINWTIASGKTLVLGTNISVGTGRTLNVLGTLDCGTAAITGAGGVTVASGSTLGIGSVDGIATGSSVGNIRVTGTRVFDVAANYVMNGANSQVTGNGLPSAVNLLVIDNGNGVAQSASVAVNGGLVLANGPLLIGPHLLTLNGDVDQESGTIVGGTTSSITVGGTGPSTVLPEVELQNLALDRTSGISLGGPVSVTDTLAIVNGILTTGTHTITLGSSATLVEPPSFPVLGTITTTRNVVQSVNNVFGEIGVEILASAASPGLTAVTRQTGIASIWNESHSILRYFDISPTTNAGLDATLVFRYAVAELNGHSPSILRLWRSTDTGASWQAAGGAPDTAARSIAVSGVSSFSRWTAADTMHFSAGQVSNVYSVSNGWNILSVPLTVQDSRKTTLFPTATSPAFRFIAGSPPQGYVQADTLFNGIGYWLKFSGLQPVSITGQLRTKDSILVKTGWNIIGSISDSIPVNSIQQVPPGIVTSGYFGYNGSYTLTSVIVPSRGYWVKVSQDGTLILDNLSLDNAGGKKGNRDPAEAR